MKSKYDCVVVGAGPAGGGEIISYNTDPLKPDTDGDGLSDGDEVINMKLTQIKRY